MLGMFLDFMGLMLFIVLASAISVTMLYLAVLSISLLLDTICDLIHIFSRKGRR